MMPVPGRGRFAPSPTGRLHFGSLIAAVGSYLNAKSKNFEWLVRIEDLDPPREQPGAADDILRTLEAFALYWDGPVVHQSTRAEAYLDAIEMLRKQRLVYACRCSRRDIELEALPGIEGMRYPGTCRSLGLTENGTALRLMTRDERIVVRDRIQGELTQNLQSDIGDFAIRRRDGLFSYQLAVVVDDAEQGITEVFRGTDLLDSTPRQVYLQQQLGYSPPLYFHCPIAVNAAGQKLSKQNLAPAIAAKNPSKPLIMAMNFLGQAVPQELFTASAAEIIEWGVHYWDVNRIPRQLQQAIETL